MCFKPFLAFCQRTAQKKSQGWGPRSFLHLAHWRGSHSVFLWSGQTGRITREWENMFFTMQGSGRRGSMLESDDEPACCSFRFLSVEIDARVLRKDLFLAPPETALCWIPGLPSLGIFPALVRDGTSLDSLEAFPARELDVFFTVFLSCSDCKTLVLIRWINRK